MERTVSLRDQDEDFLAAGRADKSKAKDPGQSSKENKSEDSQSSKMHWIEFDPTRHQFFKVMYCDFRNQLVIPRKFTIMFQEKLLDTVHHKCPSGHIWAAKLTKTKNKWIFQNGWENFVQDHGLDDADFLVFRYEGNSTFQVTIFDKTGCERESCYSIKEHTSSCSRFCSAASKVDSDDDSSENLIVLDESEEKNEQKGDSETDEGNQNREGTVKSRFGEKSYSYYLLSNRRQVTEKEKKRAHLLATEHSSTRPSFKLVMKPITVYYYFFLSIPKKWRGKHIPTTNNLEIQLRVPPSKKTWTVLLKHSKYKTGFGKG